MHARCGWSRLAPRAAHGRKPARSRRSSRKYNLLGNFAWDCSKSPGPDNAFFVHRALDNGYVQRDFMTGTTTRLWYIVLDSAHESGANQIYVTGKLGDGTWKVRPDEMMVLDATLDGQQVISGGKILSTGNTPPWLKRCK